MAAKNGSPSSAVRPPEGMARIGSVSNAPWFNLKNGNVLEGDLVNMFERPDERAKAGKSKFFQVTITAPAEVRYGRGKQAEVKMAPIGTVVNLNYGPKTKDLEPFIPQIVRGARFHVWVGVNGEKFDIGKGQTMWPVEVFATQSKAATVKDDEPDFDGVEDESDEAPASA